MAEAEYRIRTIEKDGSTLIYDIIRKKYIACTPEEWVRQCFLLYLISEMKYPRSLISVEAGLKFHIMQKRTDIVVYDRQGKPFMLVECKADYVPIDQKVMEQASIYNQKVMAPYLVATNGKQTVVCVIDFENKSVRFVDDLPTFALM